MRFARKPSGLSRPIVGQMSEEENDDGVKLASSLEPVGSAGVKIVLDNGVLKAGSCLKGKVLLEKGLPQVSNVSLTVMGVGFAQFDSDDGKEYKSRNEFLSEVIDLGSDIEQQILLLKPNDNNELAVSFQYQLPAEAPPSFTGTHGGITYECTAIVRFTSALARRRIRKAAFQVLPKSADCSIPATPTMESPSKITPPPSARTVSHTHRLSSFGVVDGTVELQLHIDETNLKRGRTPIKVALEVANKTDLHLRDLRFGVTLMVEWSAKGRRLIEKKTLAEERKDDFCLQPSGVIRLEKEFAPIPSDWTPTVELSANSFRAGTMVNTGPPVCRCSYAVFAKLVPPNFAKTCLIEIPLNVY